MPRPGYIICASSGAIDQISNSVSLFSLIETVPISRIRLDVAQNPLIRPLSLRVFSTWIREDGDTPNQIFQSQLVGHFPGWQEEIPLAEFEPFSFTDPIQRLIVAELIVARFWAPGLLLVECRLRREGETEWGYKQSYPIVLEEKPVPEPAPPNGQQHS